MIDLYDGDEGRVGIDAVVPFAVAVEMLKMAAAEGLAAELFQAYQGGPTSLQVQVPLGT
jgi:hypothetical protein